MPGKGDVLNVLGNSGTADGLCSWSRLACSFYEIFSPFFSPDEHLVITQEPVFGHLQVVGRGTLADAS